MWFVVPPWSTCFGSSATGFIGRGVGRFPTSVALVGMRDLRDYLAHAKDGVAVNPDSPFNVKAASVTLRNFNAAEVEELYGQHTAATGQVFDSEAVARAFWWTAGQPYQRWARLPSPARRFRGLVAFEGKPTVSVGPVESMLSRLYGVMIGAVFQIRR